MLIFRADENLISAWSCEMCIRDRQGADITLVDKYGDRPYSVAVQNKNQEMADYLKALEPDCLLYTSWTLKRKRPGPASPM